jgi:hypothetical protein
MGKNPAFQFYPSDWSRDLEEHSLEIEGAWIRICCKLWWSDKRGELTRNYCQWAKVLRVEERDAKRIIEYINTWKIGDVTVTDNGEVTLISRRMQRDERDRENNALRQRRFKDKTQGNASVTPSVTARSQRSSSSSSSSTSKNKEKKGGQNFVLPEWVPKESWDGFVEARKKKKGLTDRAKTLIVNKISDLRARGHDPGKLLDDAVEKGWMTVYEPKEQAQFGGNNGSKYPNRNRIPEPITRETQEGIDRINRMARELFKGSPADKTKADA